VRTLDLDDDARTDVVFFAQDQRADSARTQALVFRHSTTPKDELPLFGKDGRPAQVLVLDGFALSPTKRTVPTANGGRERVAGSMAKPWTGGSSRFALVYTPSTPGIASASLVSTSSTRAWAIVERTNTTWTTPSDTRSSKYRASPRRTAGSSTRRTALPRIEPDAGMAGI
jgi:hypothetical protein